MENVVIFYGHLEYLWPFGIIYGLLAWHNGNLSRDNSPRNNLPRDKSPFSNLSRDISPRGKIAVFELLPQFFWRFGIHFGVRRLTARRRH
jgi:hypothetical protein